MLYNVATLLPLVRPYNLIAVSLDLLISALACLIPSSLNAILVFFLSSRLAFLNSFTNDFRCFRSAGDSFLFLTEASLSKTVKVVI